MINHVKTNQVCFNTQPPEGGCAIIVRAGNIILSFQHTAARRRLPNRFIVWSKIACFNTQPPEGGCLSSFNKWSKILCFNTQPPEGGCSQKLLTIAVLVVFQHTAARRRLPNTALIGVKFDSVSTHSRPKAAADLVESRHDSVKSFNTQPPEGGCYCRCILSKAR